MSGEKCLLPALSDIPGAMGAPEICAKGRKRVRKAGKDRFPGTEALLRWPDSRESIRSFARIAWFALIA